MKFALAILACHTLMHVCHGFSVPLTAVFILMMWCWIKAARTRPMNISSFPKDCDGYQLRKKDGRH